MAGTHHIAGAGARRRTGPFSVPMPHPSTTKPLNRLATDRIPYEVRFWPSFVTGPIASHGESHPTVNMLGPDDQGAVILRVGRRDKVVCPAEPVHRECIRAFFLMRTLDGREWTDRPSGFPSICEGDNGGRFMRWLYPVVCQRDPTVEPFIIDMHKMIYVVADRAEGAFEFAAARPLR